MPELQQSTMSTAMQNDKHSHHTALLQSGCVQHHNSNGLAPGVLTVPSSPRGQDRRRTNWRRPLESPRCC